MGAACKAPPSTPMNGQVVPPVDLSAAMDPSKAGKSFPLSLSVASSLLSAATHRPPTSAPLSSAEAQALSVPRSHWCHGCDAVTVTEMQGP